MPDLIIREMEAQDEYFVATCSHENESDEIDASAQVRRRQFEILRSEGGVFKVAILDGEHIGFAYGIPIEWCSFGPLGQSLMVIPCLHVSKEATSHGAGRALIAAVEQAAQASERAGVTITAYQDLSDAEWFMPASFFKPLGYSPVGVRGQTVLLWKPFSSNATPPHFLQPHYVFEPIEGVVVVDLFWNAFCLTSVIEARRVREVCQEFGGAVQLREYCAEDRDILLQYQISRAIYVNGEETEWGHEAPKDGIRDAINRALSAATR